MNSRMNSRKLKELGIVTFFFANDPGTSTKIAKQTTAFQNPGSE